MNKIDVIREVIRLSKRSDYILKTDWISYRNYSYNSDTIDCIVVEYGVYVDTGGGWLRYYTKDITKYYEMNPIEIMLIKNLF